MTINEANGRNATRPWCTNERSMETCAVILRTIVKSLVNDVILVDLNGEVGSWAIAAVSEGIRSITAVRRPRIMEALTDRLEEAFSTHVKVELPQEPELEKMPDLLDFLKKETNRILVGLGVPVETASQPLAEAPSYQEIPMPTASDVAQLRKRSRKAAGLPEKDESDSSSSDDGDASASSDGDDSTLSPSKQKMAKEDKQKEDKQKTKKVAK